MSCLCELVGAMTRASGIPASEILGRSRRWPLPQCRWMLAEQMMLRGMSEKAAGRVLGIEHSTIAYGMRAMQELWGTPGYRRESEIKEKFINELSHGDS